MLHRANDARGRRGQIIVLFALALVAVTLMVGVVIDGGYALQQRRSAQNASDFAALAGARVIAEAIAGNTTDGTDANVREAIRSSLEVNGSGTPAFGDPDGPVYVDSAGNDLARVGAGSIPTGAVGVRLNSSRSWRPFFLGVAGIDSWTASASSTAKGGFYPGAPGGIFPVAIAEAFFDGRSPCSGPVSSDPNSECYPAHLTPGDLNVPGGFGWLKFGCDGYGLGQDPPANVGGCRNDKPFLQEEIGPPSKSYGCCTQVKLPGSLDQIGSLPGNKASADCSYYIAHKSVVTIAVWDKAGGTGQNAWYHIIGFTGFQITGCNGGKDVEGVWRQQFFLGPTTTTPGFAGQALAVQLVR